MALGFTQNKSEPVSAILQSLAGTNDIKTIVSDVGGGIYDYYNNKNHNNFSFLTPVHLRGTGTYAQILDLAKLCYNKPDTNKSELIKIVVPMISGNSKHIFTACICVEGNPNTIDPINQNDLQDTCKIKVKFFDSKVSNTKQLFRTNKSSTASIYTLLRATKPSVRNKFIKLEPKNGNEQLVIKTQYNVLSTQSYFDDKTCGLRTPFIVNHLTSKMADIKTLADFDRTINVDCFQNSLSVQNSLNILRNLGNPSYIPKTKASDFLTQAWRDVFVPLNTSDTHNEKFKNYFLKFPKEGIINKLVYFATFGFVLRPLASLIKLVVEFPLSLAYQVAHYLQTQLMKQGPRNPFLQYLRSALLIGADIGMGLFKAFHVMSRLITSPINSVKLASEVKPRLLGKALAVTSMFISISLYIGFIAFLAPIALPMLGALAPASIAPVTGLLSTIGAPLIFFSKVVGGAAMAPVTGALGTLVCALGLRKGFEAIIKVLTRKKVSYNLVGKEKSVPKTPINFNDWDDEWEVDKIKKSSNETSVVNLPAKERVEPSNEDNEAVVSAVGSSRPR